ncbi:MAG TPA: tetratricopeptide repeat protein [Tepidisphaeraceae bacterium]|jgi:predicted O-linked N-acetylglucosamine transferase (SPINDLY family)|nr:tetratricopeptide repeat protein [Tepidisphaeraceae bacterium]
MAPISIKQAFELALQHHQAGRLPEAEQICRHVLAHEPAHPDATRCLGAIADAYMNRGIALAHKGQIDESIAAFRRVINLRPNQAEGYANLGAALKQRGEVDEAIAANRHAIALYPGSPEILSNLATALKDKGELDEAIKVLEQAIFLRPNWPQALNNLGTILKDKGEIEKAIDAFRRAVGLRRDYVRAHSNLIYAMHFDPLDDAHAIAQEQRRWNHEHAERLRKWNQNRSSEVAPKRSDDAVPQRRLRIGYVSPDFRNHVVGRNILPLFRRHDRRRFEIFCYANSTARDAIAGEFQALADGFRNIVGLSDDQVAEQIRQDGIDILVDLALHMTGNRLLVFARKPAPLQVTFGGYPASTGLGAIDYRLSDRFLDPPGMDESIYSERTIRLPDSFWCYDPLDNRDIPVSSLPALEAGFITFGCLNNFSKVNNRTLDLWARALGQVAGSRLLLLANQGSHRQRTIERLSQGGIDPSRIEFVPQLPRREYLRLYHRIDVGLDSFPYNGHTTSLDSLWMGVPVVTLAGRTAVSRAGLCQLSNLDLAEVTASSDEQFVAIAVRLAADLPRLKALRSTLRARMERSPLMDAPKFARGIEAAYMQMWRTLRETGGGD